MGMELSAEIAALNKTLDDVNKGVLEGRDAVKAVEKDYRAWREANEVRIKAMEDKLAAATGMGIPGFGDDKTCKNFSLVRAAFCHATRDWKGCEDMKEAVDVTEKLYREKLSTLPPEQRVMTTATDTSAGFLVPVQQMAEMIEFLYAQTVLDAAGVTKMEGLVGSPVSLPKETTDWLSPAEVAENGAIGYDDFTTGQVTMSPRKLGRGVKISRETAQLASLIPSVEAFVRTRLMKKIALTLDLRGLRGSGSSLQALGIANVSGINTVALGTNGGPVSYDAFVDEEYQLALDNAMVQGGRFAFIMHPRTKYNARKLKDSQGRPLFDVSAQGENAVERVIGHPILATTQLPINLTKGTATTCSEIYFGNFADFVRGLWGQLRIESSLEAGDSNGSAFTNDQLWVKGVMLYDYACLRAESFCLINDVT